MKQTAFFFSFLFTFAAYSQEALVPRYLKVDEKVPELQVHFLDGNEISFESFKGKVIILEFWATYCGPCIPAMEHLAKVQSEVGDKMIVLAITDESQQKALKFLKKWPTPLQIVLDKTGKLNELFYHQFLPHTVIIGTDGFVKNVTSPENINAPVIHRIFSGAEVTLSAKPEFAYDYQKAVSPVEKSLFEMRINPPTPGSQTLVNYVSETETQFINCSIPYIYSILNHKNKDKKYDCIEVSPLSKHLLNPEELVSFNLKVPIHLIKQAEALAMDYIATTFDLTVNIEERQRNAMLLERRIGAPSEAFENAIPLETLSQKLKSEGLIPYPLFYQNTDIFFRSELPKTVGEVTPYFNDQGFDIQTGTSTRKCLIIKQGMRQTTSN